MNAINKFNQANIVGSLAAVAKQNNQSLAETFISADVIVLVDTSASMSDTTRNNKSRYDRACEELAALQNTLPGKIAVISFSSQPVFCPSGVPQLPSGMTDLAEALKFAKVADVAGMRFIIISDGEPDSEREALDIASKYVGRIDVIYVGREGGPGQKFLQKLARAHGGKAITSEDAAHLATAATLLLSSGGMS